MKKDKLTHEKEGEEKPGRNTDKVKQMDRDRDNEANFTDEAFNKFIDGLTPCDHKTKGNLYHRGQMLAAMKVAVLLIDDYRNNDHEDL